MAGLDTRGFSSGFAQGFGMMDQYQQRQYQREQTEKQAELQQERLGIEDERYQEERDFRQQQYQDTLDYRNSQQNMQNKEFGLREKQHQQQSQLNQYKIDQAESQQQRTEDERYVKGLYADWGSTGEASVTNPKELERLSEIANRSPDLVAAPIRKTLQQRKSFAANKGQREATVSAMQKLFSPGQELTDKDEQALANANTDITRAAAPEAVQATQIIDRVFDPKDDFNENSPEALEAWNLVFGDMVGEGKRIAGVYPGKTPGTITLDLDTGGDSTKPMTANRGTEDDNDNDVLEIPVDKAIETVSGFKAVAYQFALDDEARQQALNFAEKRGLYAASKPDSSVISSRKVLDNYTEKLQKITSDSELSMIPEQQEAAIRSLRVNTALSMGIHPDNLERALYFNSRGELDANQLNILRQPPSAEANSGDHPEDITEEDQPIKAGLKPPSRNSLDNASGAFEAKESSADASAIQQRLQQLAPAVRNGDKAAIELAQQLSAQLRDTISQH